MSTEPTPPPLPAPEPGAPTPNESPRQPQNLTEVFDWIRGLGIVRPDDDRWIAGVAAGLARRSGLDPVLVRGAFVALSLFLGVGIFVYGVCWLLLPHPDGRIHAEEVTRGKVTAGFVGSVVAITSGMSSVWGSAEGQWIGWGPGPLPLIALGLVVWWLLRHRRGRPADPGTAAEAQGAPRSSASGAAGAAAPRPEPGSAYEPPAASATGYGTEETGTWSGPTGPTRPASTMTMAPPAPSARALTRPYRPLTMITIGIALLAGVITHLVGNSWTTTGAVALGVIGLGLLASGLAGRRGGLLVPAGFLLALIALGPPSGDPTTTGQVAWAPSAAGIAADGYQLGAGEATLDLTAPGLLAAATAADPVTVPVQMGAGELTIILPRGAAARVEANLGAGEVVDNVTKQTFAGLGRRAVVDRGTGDPVLVVTVSQGVGQVLIKEGAAVSAPSVPSGSPGGSPSSRPSTSPSSSIGAPR